LTHNGTVRIKGGVRGNWGPGPRAREVKAKKGEERQKRGNNNGRLETRRGLEEK